MYVRGPEWISFISADHVWQMLQTFEELHLQSTLFNHFIYIMIHYSQSPQSLWWENYRDGKQHCINTHTHSQCKTTQHNRQWVCVIIGKFYFYIRFDIISKTGKKKKKIMRRKFCTKVEKDIWNQSFRKTDLFPLPSVCHRNSWLAVWVSVWWRVRFNNGQGPFKVTEIIYELFQWNSWTVVK